MFGFIVGSKIYELCLGAGRLNAHTDGKCGTELWASEREGRVTIERAIERESRCLFGDAEFVGQIFACQLRKCINKEFFSFI